MPDVRNCRRCGRLFNYIGGEPICSVCRQADEEEFQRIKKYLYEYPGATLSQVSTELEISVEKIKKFLRDGRLEIAGDNGNMILECEKCGKSIKSGRFCDECEREMASGFKSVASKMKNEMKTSSDQYNPNFAVRYKNKDTNEL
jgi:flagellar operon protein (TIGR03826 family)